MDLNMPEMNGLKAAAALPIVDVTDNVDFKDINAIYEAGMNGHLAKPVDFRKLRAAVEKFVGQREELH